MKTFTMVPALTLTRERYKMLDHSGTQLFVVELQPGDRDWLVGMDEGEFLVYDPEDDALEVVMGTDIFHNLQPADECASGLLAKIKTRIDGGS